MFLFLVFQMKTKNKIASGEIEGLAFLVRVKRGYDCGRQE